MLLLWSIFCKFGITFATNDIMKKLRYLLVFALLTTVSSVAQEINWVTFEEALKLQKEKPKKIMMDVYTNWCGPCKMLDRNTFQNKDVANYVNEHYYAVKFNAEGTLAGSPAQRRGIWRIHCAKLPICTTCILSV